MPDIAETVSYTALVTNAYFGFDNVLKGGKGAGQAGKLDTRATEAGVDLLAQAPSPTSQFPSIKPELKPAITTGSAARFFTCNSPEGDPDEGKAV
ncbi:hypothetical protein ACOJBM_06420 [Rhizobium beringeri]